MSIVNFIKPVLHPQYKLEYFKNAEWEPEWINTAENLLRTQFRSYHKVGGSNTDMGTKEMEMESSVCTSLSSMRNNTDSRCTAEIIFEEINKHV